MNLPQCRTTRLRYGRYSHPGARYFITFCTKNRSPVLSGVTLERIRSLLDRMHSEGDMDLFASVIMPDHLHLLFALGHRLSVGQVMGKIKNLARRYAQTQTRWYWQADAFEHQLRHHDPIEDYGFYIFMNPYRANLCDLSKRWPGWVCPEPARFRFLRLLQVDKSIPTEWIRVSQEIARHVVIR